MEEGGGEVPPASGGGVGFRHSPGGGWVSPGEFRQRQEGEGSVGFASAKGRGGFSPAPREGEGFRQRQEGGRWASPTPGGGRRGGSPAPGGGEVGFAKKEEWGSPRGRRWVSPGGVVGFANKRGGGVSPRRVVVSVSARGYGFVRIWFRREVEWCSPQTVRHVSGSDWPDGQTFHPTADWHRGFF